MLSITLTTEDEAALALKLSRRNAQRADRKEDPFTAEEYLATEVMPAVLRPEREEVARGQRERIKSKLDALPKARRDAILAELGEEVG